MISPIRWWINKYRTAWEDKTAAQKLEVLASHNPVAKNIFSSFISPEEAEEKENKEESNEL